MPFFLERVDVKHGGRIPLSAGAVSIGRGTGNTVALPAGDRAASAYHAVIYADPQRALLQDLQSTNGTFVNGRRVQECVLSVGDEIGLGRSGPRFRITNDDDIDGSINNINRINDNNINGVNNISNADRFNADGINNVTSINHADAINYNGDVGGINIINTVDPDTGPNPAPPAPRADIGGGRLPFNRRPIIIIVAIGLSAALIVSILLASALTPSPSAKASATKSPIAGKDFFASAPDTATFVNTPPQEDELPSTGVLASTETATAAKINAVLARFGEDGYRAPPEMVERVEHYLSLYQGVMRRTVALWLERGRRYFPMIRTLFSEKNVPIELAYVSMLESGFNTDAASPAGAVGLWQFMPHTARRYGLRVGGGVDERTDPEKATRAAAAYFKDLIAIFGSRSSTLLCMAAYNAGEQRVINALKRIDDPVRDRDFWYLYRMGWLAKETNEYIPQVIALIIISDAPEEYGF